MNLPPVVILAKEPVRVIQVGFSSRYPRVPPSSSRPTVILASHRHPSVPPSSLRSTAIPAFHRHPCESRDPGKVTYSVTWIPAFARMTERKFNLYYSDGLIRRDGGFGRNSYYSDRLEGGNPGKLIQTWGPLFCLVSGPLFQPKTNLKVTKFVTQ